MTERVVIVGRNSAVWRRLRDIAPGPSAGALALGHADVAAADIKADDVVWILSYSRDPAENRALFETLKLKGAERCYYLSTATANVAAVTRCFSYPRAKADAEADARRVLDAQVVRVGVVYGEATELPAGCCAATSLEEIAACIFGTAAPRTPRRDLFHMVERPFRSGLEQRLHKLYGALLAAAGAYPCLLRPFDLLLRTAGYRWYGYLYLSNQLWLREEAKPEAV